MWIVFFTIVVFVYKGESKIGDACGVDSSCRISQGISVKQEVCSDDGVCQCNPEIELKYSDSLQPTCNAALHAMELITKDPCNDTSCGKNLECVGRTPSALFSDDGKVFLCVCRSGFLRYNDTCREASYQKVLNSCYATESGPIPTCDLEKNSICENGKCICFDNFFANTTSGNCEPMALYTKAFNLTEYRVKPEEYCRKTSHCLEGLNCENYACTCPPPCKYNRTEEICDCGELEAADPQLAPPIIVGVILGLLIMAFWIHMINRTIDKFKSRAKFVHLSNNASPNEFQNPSFQNPGPVGPPTVSQNVNMKGNGGYVPPGAPNPTLPNMAYYTPPYGVNHPPMPMNGAGYDQYSGQMLPPPYDSMKQVNPIGSFPDSPSFPDPPPYQEKATDLPPVGSSDNPQLEKLSLPKSGAEPSSDSTSQSLRRASAVSRVSLADQFQSASISFQPTGSEVAQTLNGASTASLDTSSKRVVSARLGAQPSGNDTDAPNASAEVSV